MKKEELEAIYSKLSEEDRKQFALIGIGYAYDLLKSVLQIAKKKGLLDHE